jgi:hypothetical protein
MLLVMMVVPHGESGALVPKRHGDWEMPRALYGGAWTMAALAYTISGAFKLSNPLWLDGSALTHVLEGPMAQPSFLLDAVLQQPALLKISTWVFLGAELFFAVLALAYRGRMAAWVMMTVMHLGIVLFLNLREIPVAMLLFHLFLFKAPSRA